MHVYTTSLLASTYSSSNYDGSTYNGSSTTSTTTSSLAGGSLADTGTVVIAFVTVACLVIFVALLVRLWKKKPSQTGQVTSPLAPPAVTGTAETIDGRHRKI
jgi:hypothetical protein